MKPFVKQFDLNLAETLRVGLVEKGCEISQPEYTLFQARKPGLSCTLYQSGKLVISGKEMKEFVEFYLEPEILKTFETRDYSPRMGSDESGKGDFFGPLCVATLYADEKLIPKLEALGVEDCKRMSDKAVFKMGRELMKLCPHAVVRISPEKYNALYEKFRNLNYLLAWAHSTAIEEVAKKTGCNKVIVDKFAHESLVHNATAKKKLNLDLIQVPRAEEDIVVAAASVLARLSFLEGIENLGKTWGFPFPKGAGAPVQKASRAMFREHGDIFPKVAKCHFKTYQQVISA